MNILYRNFVKAIIENCEWRMSVYGARVEFYRAIMHYIPFEIRENLLNTSSAFKEAFETELKGE